MGCSAAKNLTVEPLNGGDALGGGDEPRHISITRRVSEVPPLVGEEPQTEMLEAGLVNNVQKTPNGLSFDIAFEENGGGGGGSGDSIIRKHPPRRFQRLEEQQTSPNMSLARLQEKLDEAEIRRQQILQNRVASAKVRKGLRRQDNVSPEGGEDREAIETPIDENTSDDPNHLKVPPDIPAPATPIDPAYI